MPLKVLIADDHVMIRKGLRLSILDLGFGTIEINDAGSCSQLLARLKQGGFTHLILDIILSDGSCLEIMSAIRKLYPDLQIMILSMQNENIYGKAFEKYGVRHFCSKKSIHDTTLRIVREFLDNVPPPTVNIPKDEHNPFTNLTVRELEFMNYLVKGYRTKEIANLLNVRPSTVSTTKAKILEKTNTANLVELTDLAHAYNV